MKVKVLGVKTAQAFLMKKYQETNRNLENGMKKAGMHLQNEVKSSIAGHRAEPTSVDTGRFLNSVDMVNSRDNAIIFSDLKYSKHLEFGTSRMKARRHFNNSLDRNKIKIIDIMKENIK